MKQHKFKNILLRTVLFLAILFALDRSIGMILLNMGDNVSHAGSFGMINKILKNNSDVIILGSSRALHHFDSEVIEKHLEKKVYNAGRGGQGLPYSRLVVDVICEKNTPGLFVLQVEPGDLMKGTYREHSSKLAKTLPFVDRSKKAKELFLSSARWNRLKYMSHSGRFNGLLLFYFFDKTGKDNFVKGYEPLHKSTDITSLNKMSYRIGKSGTADISQQALDDLREMIRLIRDAGSKVVLVSSPRWCKKQVMPESYSEIAQLVEMIAVEENVPYIKILQETHPVFNDPSLFADSAHLNHKGAVVFSQIVAESLLPQAGPE